MPAGRPLLIDACCCAGGASMGYHRAGFRVIGVDIDPQPDYPFDFVQADAVQYVADNAHRAAAVHASPPCQSHSALTKGTNRGREYPDLIPQFRALFAELDIPTVIENVSGAPIRRDLTLCGEMFGLNVIRHRHFELDRITVTQPFHVKHRGRVAGWRHGVYHDGPYVAPYGDGGGKGSVADWQRGLGIDWTASRRSLAEAIPPAYTELVGRAILSM